MSIKILIIVAILGAIVLVSWWTKQQHIGSGEAIFVHEIPAVYAAMIKATHTPTYVAFMFSTPDKPGDDGTLNTQFSMEDGKPGFDWVLLGDRNITDRSRFEKFAAAKGMVIVAREENGVKYLRIEQGDIVSFGQAVLTELYGVPSNAVIGLLTVGFDWVSPTAH